MRAFLLTLAVAVAGAADDPDHLPLTVVAAGIDDLPSPTMSVGSGRPERDFSHLDDEEEHWHPWLPLQQRLGGARPLFHLMDPRSGNAETLYARVALPMPWRPRELLRRGSEFTIVGDAVRREDVDPIALDEPADLDAKRVRVFILSLGDLPAGDYRVRLDVALRGRERDQHGRALHRVGHLGGDLAVTLPKPVTPTGSGEPVALEHAAESEAKSPPGEWGWLVPRCALLMGAGRGHDAGLVGIGRPDRGEAGAAAAPLAVRAAKADETPVAVIVGPELMSGEWIELRSVAEWLGRTHLTVAVWRDDGGRDRNVPHRDVLLVPVGKAGEPPPEVVVHWRCLRAADQRGPYHLEADDAATPQPAAPPAHPAGEPMRGPDTPPSHR